MSRIIRFGRFVDQDLQSLREERAILTHAGGSRTRRFNWQLRIPPRSLRFPMEIAFLLIPIAAVISFLPASPFIR